MAGTTYDLHIGTRAQVIWSETLGVVAEEYRVAVCRLNDDAVRAIRTAHENVAVHDCDRNDTHVRRRNDRSTVFVSNRYRDEIIADVRKCVINY